MPSCSACTTSSARKRARGASRTTSSYSTTRRRCSTSDPALDLGRLLAPDVPKLIVDPVARITCRDDRLEPFVPALALAPLHGQRGVDRIGELLEVERIDGQRVLAELLVGT